MFKLGKKSKNISGTGELSVSNNWDNSGVRILPTISMFSILVSHWSLILITTFTSALLAGCWLDLTLWKIYKIDSWREIFVSLPPSDQFINNNNNCVCSEKRTCRWLARWADLFSQTTQNKFTCVCTIVHYEQLVTVTGSAISFVFQRLQVLVWIFVIQILSEKQIEW